MVCISLELSSQTLSDNSKHTRAGNQSQHMPNAELSGTVPSQCWEVPATPCAMREVGSVRDKVSVSSQVLASPSLAVIPAVTPALANAYVRFCPAAFQAPAQVLDDDFLVECYKVSCWSLFCG
jgi:hypothetical protein